MINDRPSEQVVLQRIRNRIIEILDLFADEGRKELAHSLFEFWADWVDENRIKGFTLPIFTQEEVDAIKIANQQWEKVKLIEPLESASWVALRHSSAEALSIFMERGLISEEREVAK